VFLTTPAVATPLARHHVAATFDGDSLRAYVDGVISAAADWSLGTVYYGTEDVLIGAQNFGAGFLRRFDGFIDDVRVWDHALDASEIASRMNCRLSGGEAGLVAYWPFDASDLADATGNGHTGAIGGLAGSLSYASLASLGDCAVGVFEHAEPRTTAVSMEAFPHPTRGPLTVGVDLPRGGWVGLELFDVTGRRRGILASRHCASGRSDLAVDLSALGGTTLNPGVYFLRLRTEGATLTRRVTFAR
jgi:hypothetical protein